MNLTQLRAIVYIDIYRSLSKSAQKLFISQASLSIAIKKLEDELGCEIIKRTPQGVYLTEKGLEILRHAQVICAEIDEIARIGKSGESQKIDISVGVSSYLCNMIAIRAMLETKTASTGLNIKINDIRTNTGNILEVAGGNFDIALLQTGRMAKTRLLPASIGCHNIDARYLVSDRVNVAVPDTHPLAAENSCSLGQLTGYPYITNKDAEEDAFYLYLKENGYDRRIVQVNHILNYDIAANIKGFWAGTRTGMASMRADKKNHIHLLEVEGCEFRYDVMYICKNPRLPEPMAEFVETIRRVAGLLVKE